MGSRTDRVWTSVHAVSSDELEILRRPGESSRKDSFRQQMSDVAAIVRLSSAHRGVVLAASVVQRLYALRLLVDTGWNEALVMDRHEREGVKEWRVWREASRQGFRRAVVALHLASGSDVMLRCRLVRTDGRELAGGGRPGSFEKAPRTSLVTHREDGTGHPDPRSIWCALHFNERRADGSMLVTAMSVAIRRCSICSTSAG